MLSYIRGVVYNRKLCLSSVKKLDSSVVVNVTKISVLCGAITNSVFNTQRVSTEQKKHTNTQSWPLGQLKSYFQQLLIVTRFVLKFRPVLFIILWAREHAGIDHYFHSEGADKNKNFADLLYYIMVCYLDATEITASKHANIHQTRIA